jgi:hypothetical protein
LLCKYGDVAQFARALDWQSNVNCIQILDF